MKKNFGSSTIQRKFAHASTIYEKEFHFFNSTLMDYKAQMLEEEKEEDHKLTILAQSFVNKRSKEEEEKHPGSHHASRPVKAASTPGSATA